MKRQTLIIGDIHGCFSELQELLTKVDLTTTNVVAVGDLIDRGPDSAKVIKLFRDNNYKCVVGNHELMAIQDSPALQSADIEYTPWYTNGGGTCIRSYSDDMQQLYSDIEYFKTLPLAINTGHVTSEGLPIIVSHTDITGLFAIHDDACRQHTLLDEPSTWNRSTRPRKQLYFNVFGHTPVDYWKQGKYTNTYTQPPTAEYKHNTLNLDTGCCYDTRHRGYLTAILLPSFEVVQVKRQI